MAKFCLIFDLDGTLVDSEPLCNLAFLDLLPELDESVATLIGRYRGLKLAHILADLEQRLGRRLPADFEQIYRRQVARRFERDLRPMPGAAEMLAAVENACCIASSGPQHKIRHALELTQLTPYFGEHIFSAYDVGSWKPAPDLFLHAAAEMGRAPEQCCVIEDSEAGVRAGLAAGMHVLHFRPHGLGDKRPFSPNVIVFSHMSQLPQLVEQIEQGWSAKE